MKNFYLLLSVIGLLTFSNKTQAANDSIYEKRRNAYIDTALAEVEEESNSFSKVNLNKNQLIIIIK